MRTACARLRKSEEAVTPVIATILMVAITVVLAAVLYAMIGGFVKLTPPPGYVSAEVDGNDKNWTVEVINVQGGSLATSDIRILVKTADLEIGLKSTLVSDMEPGTYYGGVRFVEATTDGYLNVGDMFTLDKSTYAQGTKISIMSADELTTLWEDEI